MHLSGLNLPLIPAAQSLIITPNAVLTGCDCMPNNFSADIIIATKTEHIYTCICICTISNTLTIIIHNYLT